MRTVEALIELYQDFYNMRLKHLGSRSWRSLRFFYKTLNLQREYLEILETEHENQQEMYSWLCEYIERNELSSQQIIKISITLRLFRSQLQGRQLFLIIFILFLGFTGSLYKFLSSHFGTAIITSILCLNWLFGILAVWERTSIALNVTIANQLQVLLDQWVDEQT